MECYALPLNLLPVSRRTAGQWLAYAIPCRRFACVLADAVARLGADVVCYSSIVVDLHHLLLAGLPAHESQRGGTQAGAAPVGEKRIELLCQEEARGSCCARDEGEHLEVAL